MIDTPVLEIHDMFCQHIHSSAYFTASIGNCIQDFMSLGSGVVFINDDVYSSRRFKDPRDPGGNFILTFCNINLKKPFCHSTISRPQVIASLPGYMFLRILLGSIVV